MDIKRIEVEENNLKSKKILKDMGIALLSLLLAVFTIIVLCV